ncbi:MAG TPA: hypothetical protein VFZ25_14490, partial [Chloroflexota bacterium]|nr:hypothetical protein [Chloroflexota bacterium]
MLPNAATAEILVEVSDASRAGLASRLERLGAKALRHGARQTAESDWSVAPPGNRLRFALPPGEIPGQVTRVRQTLASHYRELRFEATGGAVEIWAEEFDPRLVSLGFPSEASLQLREAFRRAFDPEGLLRPNSRTSQR